MFMIISEQDKREILEQHISQGYKSSVLSEEVTPNVVVSANNHIKNLSKFVMSGLESSGVEIKREKIQLYLDTYVNELNKKSSYLTSLINKKSSAKEIAKVYTSTLIYVFHQLFSNEMNWGKRMLVRSMVDKKELDKHRTRITTPLGKWKIPYYLMELAVNSLPIDQTKKDEIFKVLQNDKDSYSINLWDYAIKTIYG